VRTSRAAPNSETPKHEADQGGQRPAMGVTRDTGVALPLTRAVQPRWPIPSLHPPLSGTE
jgi:hypothetical protein